MKTLLLATKMRIKQGEVLYTKTIVPFFLLGKMFDRKESVCYY